MNFKKIEYIDRKSGNIQIENPPGENFLKFLYHNPLGKLPLSFLVKRKFLTEIYGKKMRDEKSKSKILPFVKEYNINMEESIKSVEEFNSFNDFFIRKLKSGAREIDTAEDVLVSPADGKILLFNDIKELSKFFVKGNEFTLSEFLQDESLVEKFKNGTMAIIRLAPVDYHRFHFPASGFIGETRKISGYYYSVSPIAIRNNFKIFCENKREYSILKSENFGDILLSEIGATMVGGIVQSYTANSSVKKGEEKGYFFFGGSSCILLFEKDKVLFDSDIVENSSKGIETKIYMGERIGVKKK